MADHREARTVLEQLAGSGEKHAFRLRRGQDFLGWILEVGQDAVLVAWAPSPFYADPTGRDEMSQPDEWVRLEDIELQSLAYWSDGSGRWVTFRSS